MLRTAVAIVVGLLPLLPEIAVAGHVDTAAWMVQLLAVATAVTKVLAMPGVESLLKQYLPWLAAAPK
jgi:hypothetical protein